jgi:hypothetical protein
LASALSASRGGLQVEAGAGERVTDRVVGHRHPPRLTRTAACPTTKRASRSGRPCVTRICATRICERRKTSAR